VIFVKLRVIFLGLQQLPLTTGLGWFMVFNSTFNNISVISWQSVLLVKETGDNQRTAASH